jgi:hypothetical protein
LTALRRALVWFDVSASAPSPVRPPNVDLDRYEHEQLELLRADLLGELRDGDSNAHPLNRGVELFVQVMWYWRNRHRRTA